jgi:uncharacterized membrane protein YdjX (TVP38/TMEM64 family)
MIRPRTKSVLKLLVFVLILAVAGTLSRHFGLTQYLEQERLKSWVDGFGAVAPLIYILIFATAPSLFLPGLPITLAGGLVFGPLWGTVYASVGSTLGAGLAFLVARYFARKQIEDLLGPRLQAIDEGVQRKGWVYVATTRLIPLFPYNLLNYAFGLSKIRFLEYLLTSWICMLPATAAYVVFSSSLLDILKGKISREMIIGLFLILFVSAIPFLIQKLQKRMGKK